MGIFTQRAISESDVVAGDAALVVVEPVAPIQHDGLRLPGVVELMA
jgi:hypothetical protein